jgi:hypothetical protein
MRGLRHITLRGVVLATLPFVLLGLYLVFTACADYARVHQFDDWYAHDKHIEHFGFERVRSALAAPLAWAVDHRISPEDERLPNVRIHVERHAFDRLNDDVLSHFGEEIKAAIESSGELHNVGLKLRGDTSVHYATEKKSLTINSSRGHMFKGYRRMILSAKDVVSAYLANSLPEEFGVVASRTDIVPVFINERFWGLYRFAEPVDETFLRKHALLPGNIFRADTAERGEYFKGLEREVFKNQYIWDRAAKNDRPGSIGTAALGLWLGELNGTTFDAHRRFEEWLDRSQCAHTFALQLAVGDPFHMSGVHNQFWYEDPSSGLLRQIPWDVRLLDITKPPPNSRYNRGLRGILRDPRVLDEALEVLHGRLANDALKHVVEERMADVAQRFGAMLEYEHLRGASIPDVGSPAECVATMNRNLELLKKWVSDARIAWHAEPAEHDTQVLDCESRGYAGANLVALELENVGAGANVKLYADSDLDGVLSDADRAIEARLENGKLVLAAPEALLPGADTSNPVLAPEPIAFRFFLVGAGSASVHPVLVNRHTHAEATSVAWSKDEPIRARNSWHPWQYVDEHPPEVRLSGETHLTQTLIVPKNTTLVIEAGAHVVLDPNVSILTRSKVVAHGTQQRPIVIDSSDPRHPWGSFALQGAGCNGSEFDWMKISTGGGGLIERVEYTGMMCVHNAHDVWVRNCEFGPNLRCDDSIHADRADLNIVGCSFRDANGDSIDYDMSGGLVRDCEIVHSGNDGLDLMTCWPRVIHNHIVGSLDKGVSVGEGSQPLIFDNVIENCVRGIEAKDTSQPIVLHNVVRNNKVGVRERLKNWRYDYGGWAKVINTIVQGNKSELELHEKTHLTLAGAQIGASDTLPAPVDVPWLTAQFGLELASDRLGPVDSFEIGADVAPIARGTFQDDFDRPSDGWIHDLGVHALDKRAEVLVATFKHGAGSFGHVFDWDLSDPSQRYVLVLEYGTENMLGASISVEHDGGKLDSALPVLDDKSRFQFHAVDLPPGHYTGVLIRGEPVAAAAPDSSNGAMLENKATQALKGGASHFYLHSWLVMALPAARSR